MCDIKTWEETTDHLQMDCTFFTMAKAVFIFTGVLVLSHGGSIGLWIRQSELICLSKFFTGKTVFESTIPSINKFPLILFFLLFFFLYFTDTILRHLITFFFAYMNWTSKTSKETQNNYMKPDYLEIQKELGRKVTWNGPLVNNEFSNQCTCILPLAR